MEPSKLSEHDRIKGVFRSKFSQMMTPLGKDENWAHAKAPEYIWLALILYDGDREIQMQKCLSILKTMQEKMERDSMEFLTMTTIMNLTGDLKKHFIESLHNNGVMNHLFPLSIIMDERFRFLKSEIKAYQYTISERVEKLSVVLEEVSKHQSQLSTDIRYLIIYQAALRGKFQVMFESNIINDLNDYPFLDVEDEKMRLIQPMIRSTELGISQSFGEKTGVKYKFSSYFWKEFGRYTDCEVFAVDFSDERVDLIHLKNEVYSVLEYYRDIIQHLEQNDQKLFVLVGILTYSYKRLLELVEHDLQHSISGRTIVRSAVENYMMTKYLLKNENNHKNIWEEYQYYGIGNYKMIFERYREERPNIEKSHVKFEYLDFLISEYVNKDFIDMDTRYFGNGNIRNKFKEVEEDFLYKYLYEYDSQFEHGLWGAIRESSILKCTTSGHQFHGVPDIDNIQKMPDVGNDMISVMKKHIEIIDEAYPIPFLDIGKEDGFER